MGEDESTSDLPRGPQTAIGYPGVLRDLLPIGMWVADADGRIVQWSQGARALFGYEPDELLGKYALPLLVPEVNLKLALSVVEKVRGGEPVVGAFPVRHRDGHLVETEMWVCPIADPAGRTGTLAIAAETSAVLRMSGSLAAMEGLFAQSPIGLAMISPDLRYMRVNDALARMNDVPAADHVGRLVAEVVPDIDTADLEGVMRQVLDAGEAVVDFRCTGHAGSAGDADRTWSCSFAPLLDGTSRRLGLIGSMLDITAGQRAHQEAEQARQRFALLAQAGERIGTTLDLWQTAREVADMLVPKLADWADVQLLERALSPDEAAASARGVMRRLAIVYTDPAAPAEDLAVGQTYQIPPHTIYERVIAEGRPLMLTLSDVNAAITEPGADRLRGYLRTGFSSARLVPLVARGEVLGTVVAARSRNREPFDEQDSELIDQLVCRAALNIDNARLYTSEHQAALTLQRSLMSTELPKVPGLELAGRYLPASSDKEVGGDWFDVISLPDGRTCLVIGDVMGHGVHAAAVMGQLRTVVRTLAHHDIPPDRLLSSLDATVADLGADEMATCVYAVYDPAACSCVIARAGHPPPAVVGAQGAVEILDGPPGTPLGVGGQTFHTEQVRLPPDALLVLYTDGLIETRDRDLDQGMHQLTAALRHPDRPLEMICDHVLARMQSAPAQDDIALLLARPL